MAEVNVAAVLRENELLRSVAMKAIRLRRIGISCDTCEDELEKLYRDCPDMTRSGTQRIMLEQAFKTALQTFDEAVFRAADAGMDWTKDHGIPRPKLAAENNLKSE